MKIIINDLGHVQNPSLGNLFEQIQQDKFIILNQGRLEKELLGKLEEMSFNPTTTLFVFVGQSSIELKYRLIQATKYFNRYKIAYCHAHRVYEDHVLQNGKSTYNVACSVGNIEYEKEIDPNIKKIVVIDDVISTGGTMNNLYKRNSYHFPCATWSAFVLVSRTKKLPNFKSVYSSLFVEEKFTPINTLSKLIEDEDVRKKYIKKYFESNIQEISSLFDSLEKECVFSPHVICFDLFNTLVVETGKWFGELVSVSEDGEVYGSGEYHLTLPSYIDYLIENYSEEYSLTNESIYQFVRDNLMNTKYKTFEEMLKVIYEKLIPGKECTTRKRDSIPNTTEWYWRAGSESAEWININILEKLSKLKQLGHKLVLVTNCTYPAWEEVRKFANLFDLKFVSSVEGISKPNEEVWKIIEKEFSEFPRNKFVMIGDSFEDDLKVPKQRGWKTISAEKLCFDESDTIFI